MTIFDFEKMEIRESLAQSFGEFLSIDLHTVPGAAFIPPKNPEKRATFYRRLRGKRKPRKTIQQWLLELFHEAQLEVMRKDDQ